MQEALIGLQAAAPLVEGLGQASQLRAGARVDEENARLSLLDGAMAETAVRAHSRAVAGEAIVALGETGGVVGSGSALDHLRQSALNGEMAVLSQRYQAAAEARAYEASAADKRRGATNAIVGGVMRAGTALLTGAADMQNAGRVAAAKKRRIHAKLPGGSQLPVPHHLAPVMGRGG